MKIEAFDDATGMATLQVDLPQLKRIYRALLSTMRQGGGPLRDEGDLALKLQHFLQRKALAQGVDVTEHEEWERWLTQSSVTEPNVASFLHR